MTIKQQGGIFGRNPSFNDLETNTAYIVDELGVGESNPARVVHVKAPVPAIRLEDSDVAGLYHEFLGTAAGQLQIKADGGNVQASSDIAMVVDGTNVGTFGSTGLAMPSGKGIDFSATSGTGTSELFDDYEEGTWTPVLTTSSTDYDAVSYSSSTYGRYTKVGNMVFIQGRIITTNVTVGSASGSAKIGGLPFSSTSTNGYSAFSLADVRSWATGYFPLELRGFDNQDSLTLYYRSSVNGASSTVPAANVGTGSPHNIITFAGCYHA